MLANSAVLGWCAVWACVGGSGSCTVTSKGGVGHGKIIVLSGDSHAFASTAARRHRKFIAKSNCNCEALRPVHVRRVNKEAPAGVRQFSRERFFDTRRRRSPTHPPDPPRTHSPDNVRSRPITSDHVRHPTTPLVSVKGWVSCARADTVSAEPRAGCESLHWCSG
jgi:hypothetical protein